MGYLAYLSIITILSLSGAFANISYADILGKSINEDKRKLFFSTKQILAGIVVLLSAFLAKRVLSSAEYPVNYAYMFFAGALLLFIASGGFWNIKENIPSTLKISGFKDFIRILRSELKENKRLAYFLGFINTQGIIISFLPFVMLYAKETLNTQSQDTGNFLLYKVFGIVIISLMVFFSSKKIKYNPLLYVNVILSVVVITITLLVGDEHTLRYIFILGGIIYSLYSITMNGLLLEVSDKENRALYTGFAGAGNILPAISPLSGGLIINWLGFRPFFLLFMIIVLMSVYFIQKLTAKNKM